MGKYFGTDGFRGEANVDLTVEHAYKVGRFLGWYYGKQAKEERCRVVIGKDTRRSSYLWLPVLRLPEQTYTFSMLQQRRAYLM